MQQLRYCREDVTLSAGEGFTEHIRGQWAFDAPKAWRGVAGSGEVSCLKVERSDKSVLRVWALRTWRAGCTRRDEGRGRAGVPKSEGVVCQGLPSSEAMGSLEGFYTLMRGSSAWPGEIRWTPTETMP